MEDEEWWSTGTSNAVEKRWSACASNTLEDEERWSACASDALEEWRSACTSNALEVSGLNSVF